MRVDIVIGSCTKQKCFAQSTPLANSAALSATSLTSGGTVIALALPTKGINMQMLQHIVMILFCIFPLSFRQFLFATFGIPHHYQRPTNNYSDHRQITSQAITGKISKNFAKSSILMFYFLCKSKSLSISIY